MADLSFFPPTLLHPEAKAEVIAWIQQLPLPLESKKSTLSLWADTVGIKLTAEDWHTAIPEET